LTRSSTLSKLLRASRFRRKVPTGINRFIVHSPGPAGMRLYPADFFDVLLGKLPARGSRDDRIEIGGVSSPRGPIAGREKLRNAELAACDTLGGVSRFTASLPGRNRKKRLETRGSNLGAGARWGGRAGVIALYKSQIRSGQRFGAGVRWRRLFEASEVRPVPAL
jgi:hypothetical protein